MVARAGVYAIAAVAAADEFVVSVAAVAVFVTSGVEKSVGLFCGIPPAVIPELAEALVNA